ncbi:hypothetical protein EC9_12410 [Rosistilla ulvae]|uniref:Uncharacterized protein n=1 Tax=Rosistilla ulvae TaxID=1930277 RepID=A0A517LWQ7_9BACT|nr:hypothetical protein [Rosistilla ulvae]QDS87065.1 hypothetical protein EC9_12410 [Rosistilla ulvae]
MKFNRSPHMFSNVPMVLAVAVGLGVAMGAQQSLWAESNDGSGTGKDPSGPALECRNAFDLAPFKQGVLLFTDRKYTAKSVPDLLKELTFVRTSIDGYKLTCTRSGLLYALTPRAAQEGAASQEDYLADKGFEKLSWDDFQLFGNNAIDRVTVYRKVIEEGEVLDINKWVVLLLPTGGEISKWKPRPWNQNQGELLYNGIQLPRDWPPGDADPKDASPLAVPYLEFPPETIVIDTGRQLFVDDFLIENTTLKRTWHKARKYEGNPILSPTTDLERGVQSGQAPMAAPFSGGVWYDPSDKRFKMWYHAGWFDGTAYAESKDGIHWERPDLDVVPGTNRIVPRKGVRDSAAVILDTFTDEASQRYKMLIWSRPQGGELFTSADGIHWSDPVRTGPMGDRSTIFFNPFRNKWVYSIRASWRGRSRNYSESDDFLAGASLSDQVKWMRADNLDLPDDHWFYAFPQRDGKPTTPSLYNLDAVAYESVMLGALEIYQGPDNGACAAEGVPKLTEIHLGFSRDGFHWQRAEDRTPFIAATRKAGTWDRGYIQSNAAICLVMGDELWFYYTGFAGDTARKGLPIDSNGMYANASTGIAKLRRDGFASLDAGSESGNLTTRSVVFQGNRLFVNADCPEGTLRVEVLDEAGSVVAGFSKEQCNPIASDSTLAEVTWDSASDLSSIVGKPVRFRFHLQNGRLYSFWVSPNESGASHGFVAGGGPGFDSLIDTKGKAAYIAEEETSR